MANWRLKPKPKLNVIVIVYKKLYLRDNIVICYRHVISDLGLLSLFGEKAPCITWDDDDDGTRTFFQFDQSMFLAKIGSPYQYQKTAGLGLCDKGLPRRYLLLSLCLQF